MIQADASFTGLTGEKEYKDRMQQLHPASAQVATPTLIDILGLLASGGIEFEGDV